MTALNTLIEAERGAAGTNIPTTSLERKLDELIQEFRDFKDTYKRLESELAVLKRENNNLKESVMQHQRYLETIEAEKRSRNIIFLGVPEDEMTLNNDGEAVVIKEDILKVKEILKKIHRENIQLEDLQRLGKPSANKNRAIIVKVQSKTTP